MIIDQLFEEKKKLNELDPRNYDSDVDYYNDLDHDDEEDDNVDPPEDDDYDPPNDEESHYEKYVRVNNLEEKDMDEGVVGNMFNKAKSMFTKPATAPATATAAPAPVVPNAATQARIAAAPQGYDPNTGKPQVAAKAAPGAVVKGGTMDMTKKVVAPAANPAAAPAAAPAPSGSGKVQGIKSNVDVNTLQKFNGIVDVTPKIKPQIKDAGGVTWTKTTAGWTDGKRSIDPKDSTYQSFDDAWRVANGAQPGNVGVSGAQQAPAVAEGSNDDPMNYNAAITGSYYESREGDAALARIKSLALLK